MDVSGLLRSLSMPASLGVKPDLAHECLGGGGGWMDQPRPQKALQQTSTDSRQPSSIQKITSQSFSKFHFFFILLKNISY
jgi:hypothetical protein